MIGYIGFIKPCLATMVFIILLIVITLYVIEVALGSRATDIR
jgi:hypothetical protein